MTLNVTTKSEDILFFCYFANLQTESNAVTICGKLLTNCPENGVGLKLFVRDGTMGENS